MPDDNNTPPSTPRKSELQDATHPDHQQPPIYEFPPTTEHLSQSTLTQSDQSSTSQQTILGSMALPASPPSLPETSTSGISPPPISSQLAIAKKHEEEEIRFNNLLEDRINTAYIVLSMVQEGLHIMENMGNDLYLLAELMVFLPPLRMLTLLIKSVYEMYNTFSKDTTTTAKVRSLFITTLCLSGSILAYFYAHVAGPIGVFLLMVNVLDQGFTLNKTSKKIECKMDELRNNISEENFDTTKVFYGLCDKEFLKKDYEDKRNKLTIDSLNSIGIGFTIFDSIDAKSLGMTCLIATNLLRLYYQYGTHEKINDEKTKIVLEKKKVIRERQAEDLARMSSIYQTPHKTLRKRKNVTRDLDATTPGLPPPKIQ